VGLSLFLGTLIVSVIYILANMYLAVVPLYIATARIGSCGCCGFEIFFWFCRTLIIAVMIMISTFACNNRTDWSQSVLLLYDSAKMEVFL
jgi:APA family basic amino acid/polyamine antiporter